MKRSTGYNVLKGAADKVALKRAPATVSPITTRATQPVDVPVKPITKKSTGHFTDKGRKS